MDNITHTLVGAALAEAGLKKRTALGGITLMIAANFPDIDVIGVVLGKDSVSFRRGITHGIPALIVLPFVLAGLVWLWDTQVRRQRDPSLAPADFRQLVLVSALGIATHPTLDFMNTYGMRWLMPFVDKWFYADGLFIVDPWLLVMLIAGVLFARRSGGTRPARAALAAGTGYIVAMLLVTSLGRAQLRARLWTNYMVEPTPLVPWERDILIDDGTAYRVGTWRLFGRPAITGTIAKGDKDPAVGAAREMAEVQRFLHWSRFPFYRVVRDRDGTLVRVADARYASDDARGWAAIEVRIPVSTRLGLAPSPPRH